MERSLCAAEQLSLAWITRPCTHCSAKTAGGDMGSSRESVMTDELYSSYSGTEKMRLLASILPEIDCVPGCTDCCQGDLGIWPQTFEGWNYEPGIYGRVRARESGYEFHVVADYDGPPCRRLEGNRCTIYESRGLICRVFFKVEGELPCFRGLKPDFYLTSQELDRIIWCAIFGTVNDAKALRAVMRR